MKLYLDFEFRNSKDRHLNILCCSWHVDDETIQDVWLEEPHVRKDFAIEMHNYYEDGVDFVAYQMTAEARCLFQMWEEFGLPYKISQFKAIDLYLEYKMLLNKNRELAYGKQLIKGKEVTTSPKPLYVETTNGNHSEPEASLAACCYKILGVLIDTNHKDEMRDLIISNKPLTYDETMVILKYCSSDVELLRPITDQLGAILVKKTRSFKQKNKDLLITERYLRGEYSSRTAKMEMIGYPVNVKQIKEFTSHIPELIETEQSLLNERFPDVKPFEWNEKTGKYVQKKKNLVAWIKKQDLNNWLMTDTGFHATSIAAFQKFYRSSEEQGFGEAFIRYLRFKQSLNGFMPIKKKAKSFWDFLGSDGRARPYMGIYGAQSARSQPGAIGFIPLKSRWMRCFIEPPKGRAIVAIDYASQEFLLSAILSEDEEMMKAYKSGDPYLYFAKLDGAIPHDGTKETHPNERNIYKSTTLGIGYLMSKAGLSSKLTNDLGRMYSEEEAEGLINAFKNAYPDFSSWQQDLIDDYKENGRHAHVKLPCGWYMWGDNPNPRSVGNIPIQGLGSSILRKAVALAQDAGLEVIFTLHDAVYVEYDAHDMEAINILYKAMHEAFWHYLNKRHIKTVDIRMDVFTWSLDYSEGVEKVGDISVELGKIYLDDKGAKDYKKYSKYFLDVQP